MSNDHDRPQIFTDESYSDLHILVGEHYNGLCNDTQVDNKATSLTEFIENIHSRLSQKMRKALKKILNGKMKKKQRKAVVTAVVDEDFDGIDQTDTDLMTSVLGYRLVMERASMKARSQALLASPEKHLDQFGMSKGFCKIITGLMKDLRPSNAEYLRFYRRAKSKTAPHVYSGDSYRERKRLRTTFSKAANDVREIDLECDEVTKNDFAIYLDEIAKGYESHSDSAAEAACTSFYTQHPDFPFILMPVMCPYLRDEAGTDIGNDPGYIMSWSTPDHVEESRKFESYRDSFAATLTNKFPQCSFGNELHKLQQTTIRTGNEVASFGSGIHAKVDAVEIPGLILHIEGNSIERKEKRDDVRGLLQLFFEKKLPKLTKKEKFSRMEDILTLLHEIAHQGVFPENSMRGKDAQFLDGKLAEAKSDILAAALLSNVYTEKAKHDFGDEYQKAINLCIIGNALYAYAYTEKNSADFPYWLSAVIMLNALAENGVFRQSQSGKKVVIDTDILNKDLSSVFVKLGEQVLTVYELAVQESGISQATTLCHKMIDTQENEVVGVLAKQLKK